MKLKISIIVVALLSSNFSNCADESKLSASSPPAINSINLLSSMEKFFSRSMFSQSTPVLPIVTNRRLSESLNDSQDDSPDSQPNKTSGDDLHASGTKEPNGRLNLFTTEIKNANILYFHNKHK